MSMLSFETAKTLKEMGFPQPYPILKSKFEFGQKWYALPEFDSLGRIKKHDFILVTDVFEDRNGNTYFCAIGEHGGIYEPYESDAHICYAPENLIFCPTATDILRELGGKYYLSIESFGCSMHKEVSDCAIIEDGSWCFGVDCIDDSSEKNPHEAAAQAWIKWKQDETTRPS